MLPESELRFCYRTQAASVVDQVEQYLDHGYEIAGIIGMNPSPSCGVEVAKGKGKFLGRDEDISEKEGPGIFIEELLNVMKTKDKVSSSVRGPKNSNGREQCRRKIEDSPRKAMTFGFLRILPEDVNACLTNAFVKSTL
jgi:hypothetical protein